MKVKALHSVPERVVMIVGQIVACAGVTDVIVGVSLRSRERVCTQNWFQRN